MDLPTYTNIWRIEKRLYKLYDFRLPMPLPISWIAVFCGITIPYVAILVAIGLPFNHTLVALYVLPPGVLTWLCTRPVLENKRLHELLISQIRYLHEPRTWCRLVPLSEKNEIRVYARVWHCAPAYAEDAEVLTAPAEGTAREPGTAVAPSRRGVSVPAGAMGRPGTGRSSSPSRRTSRERPGQAEQAPQLAAAGPATWPHAGMAPVRARGGPASGASGPPVPVRAGSDRGPAGRAVPASRGGTGRATPGWLGPASPADPASTSGPARAARPAVARAGAGAIPPGRRPAIPGEVLRDPGAGRPAASGGRIAGSPAAGSAAAGRGAAIGPAPGGPQPIAPPPIEVAHETQERQGPASVPLWGRPAAGRPGSGAPSTGSAQNPPGTQNSTPGAPRAIGAPAAPAPGAVTEAEPSTSAGQPAASADQLAPGASQPGTVNPPVPAAATPALPLDADRPAPSIARALSGPDRIDSWQRRVRVVPGGPGPGKRDQETLDRDRARLPLTGPRRIVFLGCTSGAGQTVTALMTGQLLAGLRGGLVAAIDLNPGHGSLARRAQAAPALTVAALLAGSAPPARRVRPRPAGSISSTPTRTRPLRRAGGTTPASRSRLAGTTRWRCSILAPPR